MESAHFYLILLLAPGAIMAFFLLWNAHKDGDTFWAWGYVACLALIVGGAMGVGHDLGTPWIEDVEEGHSGMGLWGGIAIAILVFLGYKITGVRTKHQREMEKKQREERNKDTH